MVFGVSCVCVVVVYDGMFGVWKVRLVLRSDGEDVGEVRVVSVLFWGWFDVFGLYMVVDWWLEIVWWCKLFYGLEG